eukprot:scaffold212_cov167-Skeletonema_marinoi.AAC.2
MKLVINKFVGGRSTDQIAPSLRWHCVVEFSSTTFWELFEGGKDGSSASRPDGLGAPMYTTTKAVRQVYRLTS